LRVGGGPAVERPRLLIDIRIGAIRHRLRKRGFRDFRSVRLSKRRHDRSNRVAGAFDCTCDQFSDSHEVFRTCSVVLQSWPATFATPYTAEKQLSTNRCVPLTKLASSDARKSAAAATSDGSHKRPCCAAMAASVASTPIAWRSFNSRMPCGVRI